jgi:hypothetical protein
MMAFLVGLAIGFALGITALTPAAAAELAARHAPAQTPQLCIVHAGCLECTALNDLHRKRR